ncbi:hypothetical protein RR48_04172 [Papilio machaon]|uniref:Uncharacterized protein n=1 Tax=Papilio machaon TaxID=76193 RepID=A0A0N1I532_PAPMA|nr:hypothetical protein RR48_04172 [Papilio machaon]
MEQPKGDSPKHPDMIMCGDHPSVTKTELNAREPRADKAKPKPPLSHSRITPSSSRTERPQPPGSELALRCAEGTPPRADMLPAANKALKRTGQRGDQRRSWTSMLEHVKHFSFF